MHVVWHPPSPCKLANSAAAVPCAHVAPADILRTPALSSFLLAVFVDSASCAPSRCLHLDDGTRLLAPCLPPALTSFLASPFYTFALCFPVYFYPFFFSLHSTTYDLRPCVLDSCGGSGTVCRSCCRTMCRRQTKSSVHRVPPSRLPPGQPHNVAAHCACCGVMLVTSSWVHFEDIILLSLSFAARGRRSS
ncbi:hypothetical protein C8F04DRAFT_1156403 [Mycena alexandri]|uniref:Uncharacterized protein n=1 Tax=Mycena alexandri TaxID=1745969 RepID=A0AAD6RYA8_9AGAR|nr:hypothetical protein C8F04DRAFT_1156403 [Mycena alexandri]